jgi:ribokinase
MGQIHVAGSINIDITVQVNQRPRLGETVIGQRINFTLGGKGANQAIAATRLGSSVRMIGSVGADDFGRRALESLESEDISLEFVSQVSDTSTGMALITVDATSENTVIVIPGCNMTLSEKDVRSPSIGSEDIAVSQFEIPQSTVRAFFETAKQSGATTVLNPAPANELHDSTATLVDYLIINETEAVFYSGLDENPPLSRDRLIETCQKLRTFRDQTIIITLGGDGLLASTPSETISLDTYSVDTVDTTGAGDAFVGAFVSALEERRPLREALDFANAAGAMTTTSEGASTAIPTPEKINDLLTR